jgi:hypothetical protein
MEIIYASRENSAVIHCAFLLDAYYGSGIRAFTFTHTLLALHAIYTYKSIIDDI